MSMKAMKQCYCKPNSLLTSSRRSTLRMRRVEKMQPRPSSRTLNRGANLTRTSTTRTEDDPTHHLAGPLPQTSLGSLTDRSATSSSVMSHRSHVSPWLRWAVEPSSSFKVLCLPILLYVNWELVSPFIKPSIPNPFGALFLLSGRLPTSTSSPNKPMYAKSYADLLFIAYYIVFFSFVRQLIAVKACRPIAKYFRLKREKIDRFGEQGYALVYFMVFGTWGLYIMSQLRTWWYRTEYFWIDYPHWKMTPHMKRFYLMQSAYWCQQLLIIMLKLEKPRKDYMELVAHHIVTLWLIGWSYFMDLTLIGNAVFMSMDIPDTFLAMSKLLNYVQWDKAKVYIVICFMFIWTYFRHYLYFKILRSVWYEYDLALESSKLWSPADGTYLVSLIRYHVFVPLVLLQLLNLFWFYLILCIIFRGIVGNEVTDVRSDDEDEKKVTKED